MARYYGPPTLLFYFQNHTRHPWPARAHLLFAAIAFGVVLQINHVGLRVFIKAVLAVSAANTGFAPAGVVALHGLEIFAVDIGLSKTELVAGAHRYVDVRCVEG